MDERYEPADITIERERAVTITFVDGRVAAFALADLRQACPCAGCRAARDAGRDPWPTADPSAAPPLAVRDASLSGAWGLSITWNDGHAAGIYPFEALRRWADDGEPLTRPDSGFG